MAALEAGKSVLVADLSKQYGVTEETIRRDLEKLEREGLAQRTYGGAVLAQNLAAEPPYRMRAETHKAQKLIIANKIAAMIEPKETLLLDASSTCVLIAKKLKKRGKLTIITNSVEILMECADAENLTLISTGGNLRGNSLSLIGQLPIKTLSQFTVDRAILSCKGLDFTKGTTESNLAEAEIKRAMAANAQQVILAADNSKFGRISFAQSLDFAQIHCVVSDTIPGDWMRFLDEYNVKYL